ncbi:MAG: DNA polymerase I [Acidobacteria bacterium]|nr:DNA polymerase I [Acidobacteriota bacterium]
MRPPSDSQTPADTNQPEGQPSSVPTRRLFLIDAMGYIFRAYHALPRLTNRSGLATHAVYGFHNMLKRLLATCQPEYIAAVFDLQGPTFRHETFAAYKANREEMPEDLVEQLPYIRSVLEAFHVPVVAQQGYEADDVIGTLAREAAQENLQVVIVSSDKDMLQLVEERVWVLNPMKDDLVYDRQKVAEAVGVSPEQIPDVMALQGDAIDNIPGAPGIGEKGARDLIQKYGRVETCLERASEVARKNYRDALTNNRDQILLSKQLATIDTQVPVKWSLEEMRRREPDPAKLKSLYQELGFTSLLKDVLPVAEASHRDYQELESREAVERFLREVPAGRAVAVAVRSEGLLVKLSEQKNEMGFWDSELSVPSAPLVCSALSVQSGVARIIPASLLAVLKPWLEDPGQPKAVHDSKSARLLLRPQGIQLEGAKHDTLLYSYLLDANQNDHQLGSVVERRFGVRPSGDLAEEADWVGQLAALLEPDMKAAALESLYQEIELPLALVLAEMEMQGVKLDVAPLRALSLEMEADLEKLRRRIYELTGAEFNVNSPKQLGQVLFEKMGLPAPRKRGKAKALSTAVDVLEELAAQHEVPRRVLEYRQLAKLKSTYVDTLPQLVNPRTGRLHTSYNQAGAATGRLSSSNPNLQNIPIRTEVGRKVRAAFVAEKGFVLLAADYSQIELRLLAHYSEDHLLVEAFRRGDDIHALTATAVFGVPAEEQSSEHRRRAKAINYGIIYGISGFGLSQQLGVPREEAEKFISEYFNRYQGVKAFIEHTLEEVRKSGQVRTLFGRLRQIPDINSKDFNARGFAERTAINTPLQGTAADLIKLAMIRIHRSLQEKQMQSRLILQVHDELVLEAPEAEVAAAAALVREQMEQVHPLCVPLVADVMVGTNWRDMEDVSV